MKRSALLLFCLFAATVIHGQLQTACLSTSFGCADWLPQSKNKPQQFFSTQPFSAESGIHKQSFKRVSNLKQTIVTKGIGYPPPLFYLQNSTNAKKTLQLKRTKLTLFIDESTPAAQAQISRFNSVECLLDSMNGDSVVVTLLSEEIDIDYRNKYTNITNTYFGGSFNKVQKSIALKNIVYLQTRNPLRTGLSKAGTVLMAAAIVLIVGSPFAGMRQEGDARIAARERVFSTGLACFATSVPLFIFGKPKKYHISSNYKSRKNAYWNLLQH